MLKGSGWKKGQECAHSWLKNHPLSFIGRGKILTQALWPGMEARLRKSNGQLVGTSVEAVDADSFFVDRNGNPRKATVNRLRFGQDGALTEGAYTADFDSDLSDHSLSASGVAVPVRTLLTGEVTDPLGGNTATKLVYPAISSAGDFTLTFVSYGADQTSVGQSVWLRGASGGETIYLSLLNTAANTYIVTTCTLTTSWQRFVVGGGSKQYVQLGIDLRSGSGQSSQSAQTIYAWGSCIQNQFGFGTGTVDGDDPITVSAEDIQYAITSEDIVKAAQGTLFAAVTPQEDGDILNDHPIIDFRTAGDGIILFVRRQSDNYWVLVRSGGASVADLSSTTSPVRGIKNILAMSWALNNFRLYIAGVEEASDTVGAAPGAVAAVLEVGRATRSPVVASLFGNLANLLITEPVLSVRQVENVTVVLRRVA